MPDFKEQDITEYKIPDFGKLRNLKTMLEGPDFLIGNIKYNSITKAWFSTDIITNNLLMEIDNLITVIDDYADYKFKKIIQDIFQHPFRNGPNKPIKFTL